METKCLNCGKTVLVTQVFCDHCGNRLQPQSRAKLLSLFYSYAHNDEDLRSELEAHLATLRRSGLIEEWHDRKLIAGQDWNQEISKHLESADLILFLISSDFINSRYIWDIEVKRALERQLKGDAVVIPVILRPVAWTLIPELSRLQALPTSARPVTDWPTHDLAFVSICEGLVAVILSTMSASRPERRKQLFLQTIKKRSRKRVLDAGLPARVSLGRPSTLLVLVRRADSLGLRAIVDAEPGYGIESEDVDSQPVALKFPVDERGNPQPLNLRIRIESPQFEPKFQNKEITVPPRGDSDPRVFLLTPMQLGTLIVNVEIRRDEEILAGCVLRTFGTDDPNVVYPAGTAQCISSAPLAISDNEEKDVGVVAVEAPEEPRSADFEWTRSTAKRPLPEDESEPFDLPTIQSEYEPRSAQLPRPMSPRGPSYRLAVWVLPAIVAVIVVVIALRRC